MIRVHWFLNRHENRNYWLRFGLMRKHRKGDIRYAEYPLKSCVAAGFDPAVATHDHRHTSVILVENGSSARRCIVDSEDSFFFMSPLLLSCSDLYFCSGYNRAFFEAKTFAPPYHWMQPHEVSFYVLRARDLVRTCGGLFSRVRPFVPIGPEMHFDKPIGFTMRKLRNVHHKLTTRVGKPLSWRFAYSDFDERYRRLLALRNMPCRYDITLLDSLWGWPRHRFALHLRLRELAKQGRIVHAKLRWSEPLQLDGGDRFPLSPEDFPLETGQVVDYETMLASSRLAVFATGFHWGWRSIMTLALLWGLPIHADRLILEPWFAMDQFEISWNDEPDWPLIGTKLAALSDTAIARTKAHNQAAFDRVLTPEKVADYFVDAATSMSPIATPSPSRTGRE